MKCPYLHCLFGEVHEKHPHPPPSRPWGSQPTGWKVSVYIETSCKTLKLVLFVQPQPEDSGGLFVTPPAVSHTARLGGGVRRWGVLEGSANWARHEHNNGGGDRHTCVPAVAGLTSYWSEASLATMHDLSTYTWTLTRTQFITLNGTWYCKMCRSNSLLLLQCRYSISPYKILDKNYNPLKEKV